jgi:hypothetical protein
LSEIVVAWPGGVTMMSLGAAACAPEQQAEVGSGSGAVATLVLLAIWLPLATGCSSGPCLDAV